MATQIHTGFQRRVTIGSAMDNEGNVVPVTSFEGVSDTPGLVSAAPGGPQEVIVADVSGAGTGQAIVTFTVNGTLSTQEIFEIVAGDAVVVTLAIGDEEPRP